MISSVLNMLWLDFESEIRSWIGGETSLDELCFLEFSRLSQLLCSDLLRSTLIWAHSLIEGKHGLDLRWAVDWCWHIRNDLTCEDSVSTRIDECKIKWKVYGIVEVSRCTGYAWTSDTYLEASNCRWYLSIYVKSEIRSCYGDINLFNSPIVSPHCKSRNWIVVNNPIPQVVFFKNLNLNYTRWVTLLVQKGPDLYSWVNHVCLAYFRSNIRVHCVWGVWLPTLKCKLTVDDIYIERAECKWYRWKIYQGNRGYHCEESIPLTSRGITCNCQVITAFLLRASWD